MRTNKKLAMAITIALFSVSGTASAVSGLTNLLNAGDLATTTYAPGGLDGGVAQGGAAAVIGDFEPANHATPVVAVGITYASEIFGTSPSTLPTGSSAGVIYEIDGAIDEDFFLTFSLDNGAFGDDVELFTNANSGSLSEALGAGTVDGNEVKFTVEVDDVEAIQAASKFLLKYQLADTEALSQPAKKIRMTVEATSVGTTPYLVNVSDDVQVATSAQAVEIEIKGIGYVDTKIATSLGSTEFTSDSDDGNAYVGTNEVRLGFITVTHDDTAMSEDGFNPFILGNTVGDGEVVGATFTITDGQFAASKADPGEVKLDGISADDVSVSNDGTTAIFTLTDVISDLGNAGIGSLRTEIRMVLDSINEVNIPENDPCAILSIDYDGSNINDLTVPNDGSCISLAKIPQDGTICWVNIIPKAEAVNDRLSILITNNGVDEGELFGTMYSQAGEVLFTSQILKDSAGTTMLGAGKTMRLTAADLGTLMEGADADNPGTWSGRSVLKISTVVSDLEILALIRDINSNINSNVSQGAAGASCTK